jgi:hypothetical protein
MTLLSVFTLIRPSLDGVKRVSIINRLERIVIVGLHGMGNPVSMESLVRDITKGQSEFARVAKSMCFKWCETSINLERILTCFTNWNILFKMKYKSNKRHGRSQTWLVKMVRKSSEIELVKRLDYEAD